MEVKHDIPELPKTTIRRRKSSNTAPKPKRKTGDTKDVGKAVDQADQVGSEIMTGVKG